MKNFITIENSVRTVAIVAFAAAIILPWHQRPLQSYDRFTKIASALESYAADHGGMYPPNPSPFANGDNYLPNQLTTPFAYLSPAELNDPLSKRLYVEKRYRYLNMIDAYAATQYYPQRFAMHGAWMVWSPGYTNVSPSIAVSDKPLVYDPTNGTLSGGIMLRNQKMLTETGILTNQAIN